MTDVILLGRRAVREVVRYPEATIPTLFILVILGLGVILTGLSLRTIATYDR